jgi:hypothetical protein
MKRWWIGHATVQGIEKFRSRGFQAAASQIGKPAGISFTVDECLQDRPATDADDVTHDLRQLQVASSSVF